MSFLGIGSTSGKNAPIANPGTQVIEAIAAGPQADNSAIIAAQTREINRIKGYKVQLTPADNKRLDQLQEKILQIQEKAQRGTANAKDFEDRTKAYAEANEIIGKKTLTEEQSKDPAMEKLASGLAALMKPKLSPAVQQRVSILEKMQASLEEQLNDRPDSPVLKGRYQIVVGTLAKIAPLRRVTELSPEELKDYDQMAAAINKLAGFKLQLPSKDALRVAALERAVTDLSV